MTTRKAPPDLRAKSILERLSGSSDALDGLSEQSEDLAVQLQEIEQLFVLHGGERGASAEKTQRPRLFSWGHLDVLDKIGEGSFGEVFRAYDSILDRDVALKLLKTGQQRPFQSQLFLHEGRQLAMVRHPNVLAVHGAAIHEGRPGLWSDLIEGETLSNSEASLQDFTQNDWLDLIESLCLGLRAVHDAGLLHGDVKPSNIMRDRHGPWVLMDFGASLDRRHEKGGPAMTSGTPLYMAPEAVLGKAPSTAADTYALGASLYRVMTGKPVHAAQDWNALSEIHTRAEPVDFGTLEEQVSRPVASLVRSLLARAPENRPDIDAILSTIESIRTAPERRFKRFAITAVIGALAVGLAFTGWGLIAANQARAVAEQEQRNTAAVNEFLQRLLSAPDDSGQVRDMTVEEMLDWAARDVRKSFDGQAEALAAVHLALAESYGALNLPAPTLEQVRLGVEQLALAESPNPRLSAALELEAIAALQEDHQHEQSLLRAEKYQIRFAEQLPADSDFFAFARGYQISNLISLERYQEAERLLDRHFARVPEPESAINNLGYTVLHARSNLYRDQGRFDEAVAVTREMLDWLDRYPQDLPNARLTAMQVLALNLRAAGQKREALSVMETSLSQTDQVFGSDCPCKHSILNNLFGMHYDLGEMESALRRLEQALEIVDANPGLIDQKDQWRAQGNRANLLNAIGRYDEGEALIRDLMGKVKMAFGDQDQLYLLLIYNLTELLNIRERFAEALPLAEQTTEKMREALGDVHPFVVLSESNRAQSLAGLGRADDALVLHDQARETLVDLLGPDHQYSLTVRRQAMESRERLAPGSVPEADIRALIETYTTQTSAEHPETRKAQALLDGLN